MKKINVTFSLPLDVNEALHAHVPKRRMSSFVAEALKKALEDKTDALKKAYALAEKDVTRRSVIKDWEILDNEDWE